MPAIPFRYLVPTGCLIALAAMLQGAAPSWWTTRQVLDPNQQTDDYAAVNAGQLKHMAQQAYLEFQAKLPGRAGSTLSSLIGSFSVEDENRDDFVAVNAGQLKAVAKPFYDRLIATGLQGDYPWDDEDPARNDYALVNIGQLKHVFSFDLVVSGAVDTDEDSLPDTWEDTHFSDLSESGTDDSESPSGDSLTNEEEFWLGTDPNAAAVMESDSELGIKIYTEIE